MPLIIKSKDDIICSRCGKCIENEKDIIKLTQSDPFYGREESFWCRDCYEDFIADLSEEAYCYTSGDESSGDYLN